MKIEIKNSFIKEVRKYSGEIKVKIEKLISLVEQVNSLADINDCKKLQGFHNYYRIRLGNFRVGIKYQNDKVYFVRFLSRGDFYKYFP